MTKYYYPSYPLRISPQTLHKVKYLARRHKRSANKEIEFVLEQYVEAYEKVHGEIPLPRQNGSALAAEEA